jgi:hypothetical protein
MIARGRVQNGVVVLEEGVRLSEGQEVTVLAPGQVPEPGPEVSDEEHRRIVGEIARDAVPAIEVSPAHSILDIPAVSLGSVLSPVTADDLLGEMLEGRS